MSELKKINLGRTGLLASEIGFGCYRINEHDPDHREALRLALLQGCNLIESSSNYADGSSERLIGEVVSELISQKHIERAETVIVTKAGYIQGTKLKHAKNLKKENRLYNEVVFVADDCWHCISPEFLQESLLESLHRLRVEYIDIFLIHNPEYFLKSAKGSAIQNTQEFYNRIEKAFKFLEEQVKLGRIKWYGVSSNGFNLEPGKRDYASADQMLKIAKSIQAKHHFAAIEFPFNLYESNAYNLKNVNNLNLFEWAEKEKIAVLTNRPFNSMYRNRLQRLTSFKNHNLIEIKGRLHSVLGRGVEIEKNFTTRGFDFNWAHVIRDKLSDMGDVIVWKDTLQRQVLPNLRNQLDRARLTTPGDLLNEYVTVMSELFLLITQNLEVEAHERSQVLMHNLDNLDPQLKESLTLSQKVLQIYRAFNSCTLVGMRHPDYVRDVLSLKTSLEKPMAANLLKRITQPMDNAGE